MERVTRTVLIADEGMVLTNGTAYGKSVYLGAEDDVSKWYEISEDEFNKITATEQID